MTAVWPGGTIGILGGGQLGRMMAFEARRLGYRVAVLDPEPDGPAGQVADLAVQGSLDDPQASARLARAVDVITLDTDHVPAGVLEQLEKLKPVRPSAAVLRVVQDRLEQRRFLDLQGAPQARNAPASDPESLRAAAETVGFPCVLKTRRSGYDGRGQVRVGDPEELDGAWGAVGHAPVLLESWIEFEKEISVLLARDLHGNVRFYPIAENTHRRHILHTSRVPARVPRPLRAQAEDLGIRIASALGHVGVMAVELFVTREGGLLVNEIAPRTHNSGHYTFGACATSQFEQHVRAVCGLPLGDTSLLRPAVMVNLLGDLWRDGAPSWEGVLSHPGARLHLYGKKRPRAGRKMGHVLILDEDVERAAGRAEDIVAELDRQAASRAPRDGERGWA